jgi:hypothetical protein
MQLGGFLRSAVLGLLNGYWVGTGNVKLLAILAHGVGFVAFDTTGSILFSFERYGIRGWNEANRQVRHPVFTFGVFLLVLGGRAGCDL